MNSSNSTNYLFYSSRCESSANFIRILQNKGLFNMFHLVSIDKMPTEQIINLGISYTPTVIIKELSQNSSNSHSNSNSFEGKKAFEWLERIVKFREENMARIVEMNRKKILQNNAQVSQNNDILSFQPLETSGISDTFSYTAENLHDVAQPKSFMPYGSDTNFKIATFTDNQSKISSTEMNEKLKLYTEQHSKQTDMINNLVETQMKNTLINKLQNNN